MREPFLREKINIPTFSSKGTGPTIYCISVGIKQLIGN